MIRVASLFGNVDLQKDLREPFKKSRLVFVGENCQTGVQLLNQIEECGADVALIAAAALDMIDFIGLVREIYQLNEQIRIILILNGSREHYYKGQLDEYQRLKIDLIFDHEGFSAEEIIACIKKEKRKSRESEAVKPKNSVSQNGNHYSIAVFGLTHGAGVTSTVISLARYFGLQNRNTAAVDFTGTKSLALANCKEAEMITGGQTDIDSIKACYDVTVIDFGVPYDISPDGSMTRISSRYRAALIPQLFGCDIKIGMGFLEPWQIGKVRFFFDNDVIDQSFVFLFNGDPKNLKQVYPFINLYHRDDEEFREIISNLFSEGR